MTREPAGRFTRVSTQIGSYHELGRIEKSFRPSKHHLRARPVYHRERESIDVHLAVMFAALAVTRFIEARTGCSIKKFIRRAHLADDKTPGQEVENPASEVRWANSGVDQISSG